MTDCVFTEKTRSASLTDEWFTPESAITPLLPYLTQFKRIWTPFDHNDSEIQSNFVKVLKENGHEVINSHIEYGQDFFDFSPPPIAMMQLSPIPLIP